MRYAETLREREKFIDGLWTALLEQTNDEDEMEVIKAIEYSYAVVEDLRVRDRISRRRFNRCVEDREQQRVEDRLFERRYIKAIRDYEKFRRRAILLLSIAIVTGIIYALS